MLSLSSLTLVLALLISTYLTQRSIQDPNDNITRQIYQPAVQGKRENGSSTKMTRDRVKVMVDPRYQILRNLPFLVANLSHLVLVLFLRRNNETNIHEAICPHSENLNLALFSWNWYTASCIIAMIIGGLGRIKAYNDLGKNFTFAIQRPSHLVSNGLYRYVQHPSYTAQVFVMVGHSLLTWRWDGAIGCWLSAGWRDALTGKGWVAFAALFAIGVSAATLRVRDEERMLKSSFEQEWEGWRRQRKRFVPGLF